MGTSRFYAGPDPLESGPRLLPPAEAVHATAARRLRPGEVVSVFDGRGREAEATIKAAGRRGLEVEVGPVKLLPAPDGPQITLGVALPKGPRQDAIFEKTTELGVACIWPMITTRSVVKPSAGRVEKWSRTAIEASKQCGRSWLPEIREAAPFCEVLQLGVDFDQRFIASPAAAGRGTAVGRVLVLIGPEGGFALEELADAQAAGFTALGLGRYVLRVETAAIAAVARLSE